MNESERVSIYEKALRQIVQQSEGDVAATCKALAREALDEADEFSVEESIEQFGSALPDGES